jgi:hypothetical protein
MKNIPLGAVAHPALMPAETWRPRRGPLAATVSLTVPPCETPASEAVCTNLAPAGDGRLEPGSNGSSNGSSNGRPTARLCRWQRRGGLSCEPAKQTQLRPCSCARCRPEVGRATPPSYPGELGVPPRPPTRRRGGYRERGSAVRRFRFVFCEGAVAVGGGAFAFGDGSCAVIGRRQPDMLETRW